MIDIRSIFSVILYRWRWILIPAIAGLLYGSYKYIYNQPTRVSKARILIRQLDQKKEGLLVPLSYEMEDLDIETEIEYLRSPILITKASEALGVQLDRRKVIKLKSNISVEPLTKRSRILLFEFRWSAQNQLLKGSEEVFLDSLISNYQKTNKALRDAKLGKIVKLLEREILKVEDSLEVINRSLKAFQRESLSLDFDVASSVLQERIQNYESRLESIDNSLGYYESTLNYLAELGEVEIPSPSTYGIKDPIFLQLVEEFNKLNSKYVIAKKQASELNPYIARSQQQFESLIIQMTENARIQNDNLKQARENILVLLENSKSEYQKLPENKAKWAALNRSYVLVEDHLKYLVRQRTQAELANYGFNSSVEVLEAPTTELELQSTASIIVWSTIGFLMGLVVLGTKEFLFPKVYSSKDYSSFKGFRFLGIYQPGERNSGLDLKIRKLFFRLKTHQEGQAYLISRDTDSSKYNQFLDRFARASFLEGYRTVLFKLDTLNEDSSVVLQQDNDNYDVCVVGVGWRTSRVLDCLDKMLADYEVVLVDCGRHDTSAVLPQLFERFQNLLHVCVYGRSEISSAINLKLAQDNISHVYINLIMIK